MARGHTITSRTHTLGTLIGTLSEHWMVTHTWHCFALKSLPTPHYCSSNTENESWNAHLLLHKKRRCKTRLHYHLQNKPKNSACKKTTTKSCPCKTCMRSTATNMQYLANTRRRGANTLVNPQSTRQLHTPSSETKQRLNFPTAATSKGSLFRHEPKIQNRLSLSRRQRLNQSETNE